MYPRVAECDPVLYTVPEDLEAQVSVVPEETGHAGILPPTESVLEQLPTEKWAPRNVWGQPATHVGETAMPVGGGQFLGGPAQEQGARTQDQMGAFKQFKGELGT